MTSLATSPPQAQDGTIIEREPVAVVGLGCIMPDANDVATFWKNILEGRNSIREVPAERWDASVYYDPTNPSDEETSYTKIGGFVTNLQFNPITFRIPPNVVKDLDEVQQMAILATAQALADAGYDRKEFDRSRVAIILGQAMGGERQRATTGRVLMLGFMRGLEDTASFKALATEEKARIISEYKARMKSQLPPITEDTMPGELSNVVAGRVANVFNLTGPNFTTDAACASSLAAIDAAVKALQSHEVDLAITGGADRSMDVSTYVKFCKIGALSAKGSFPFDARADGFVMGEGTGVLLLKRLADAERDGDKIYALVRGVGSSSDGKGKGITAPNIEGQIKAVERAYASAGVDPSTVQLIEAHGTSTRVGDVVEVEALGRVLGSRNVRPKSVALGSVKSQIGHLKAAAGAASLIKAAIALKERILPPSINFETPNPKIDWERSPVYVNTTTRPWPNPPAGEPRRAAVSSFGFGGTNFHVILEEYVPGRRVTRAAPQVQEVARTPLADVLLKRTGAASAPAIPLAPNAGTEVLLLGGADEAQLRVEAEAVRSELASGRVNRANLAHFCYTTSTRNRGMKLRLAIVAESPGDMGTKLDQGLAGIANPAQRGLLAQRGIHVGLGPPQGKLAFLFPGQGSQYVDMLKDLASRYERARLTLAEADATMTPLIGRPLTQFIFLDEATGVNRDAAEDALKRTEICQPAVLAVDAALYRLLGDHGIAPDMVAGHSLGEYGALVAAGVLTLRDAMVAVSARGREMANLHVPDLGKMASVSADTATVEGVLKEASGYVIPANKNCRAQTVIAGGSDAVDRAVALFNSKGIPAQPIPVSAAFHSEIVAPARGPFRKVLERLDIQPPKIPVLSNVHADFYPNTPNSRVPILDLLTQQIAAPVEWQRQIERMHHDGIRAFIEVGPKKTLTSFVASILEGMPHAAVATNHPKKGGFWHFGDALAFLAAAGYPVTFQDPLRPDVSSAEFRKGATAYQPAPAAPSKPTMASATGTWATPPAAPATADGLSARVAELGLNLDRILVTGVGAGTPGKDKPVFADDGIERILRGENLIDLVPEGQQRAMLAKNIVRLVKSATGDHRFETIHDLNEVIHLMGRAGDFDLARDYGVSAELIEALDVTSAYAIAVAIEALRDAGIPLVQSVVKTSTGKYLPGDWVLPVPLQDETGVVFASAFPGMNRLIEYVAGYFGSKSRGRPIDELAEIYADLIKTVRDPEVRRTLTEWFTRNVSHLPKAPSGDDLFEFNRRFLFHVLSMGHAQVAQLIKAKGPNTQVNSACSSTTVALSVAEDWIRMGRCKRVLVVGADDITSERAAEWFGAGFLAAGAATTKSRVEEAALPFDRRRHGMIIGMGAIGLVVEAEAEVHRRGQEGIVEIVGSILANSAYHGSRLHTEHVADTMDRLVAIAERRLGVPRREIAQNLLFMSHETYTPARGGSAAAEILALRRTFGQEARQVVVANTKGFTGHPMGASIEDAVVIKALQTGRVPPIANLKEPDPELGDLNLSRGGTYNLGYALRLSAGFGSQIALTFFKLRSKDTTRIVDAQRYQAWLVQCSGNPRAELEVVHRTLRVKSTLTQAMKVEAAPKHPAKRPTVAPAPPPATPKPVLPMPIAPTPRAAPLPTAADDIRARLIDLVAGKTGYPKEMLDPDLDLEADLGIDTVKQAEIFGLIRESYGLAQDPNLQLKDYPTLNALVGYLRERLPIAGAPVVATGTSPAPRAPPTAPIRPAQPAASVAGKHEILERLLELVVAKTGYPKEMLEPDLDMEADLGIDTVKQAEIFGTLRESYGIEQEATLQLKDYPTISAVAGYLASRLAAPRPSASSVPAVPVPEPVLSPAPAAAPPKPMGTKPVAPGAIDRGEVLGRIRALVAAKTGYPPDLLEDELDLEADLGIDTVKQAEIFGEVRELFSIPTVEGLQISQYPTLSRVADFVLEHRIEHAARGRTVAPVTPDAPSAPRAASTLATADLSGTSRHVVRYVLVPEPNGRTDAKAFEGRVLVGFSPRSGQALAQAVERLGGRLAALEELPTTLEDAVRRVGELRSKFGTLHGLVIISPSPDTGGHTQDGQLVKSAFVLLKALLAGGTMGDFAFLGVGTRLGGDFGASGSGAMNPLDGALAGLAKAVGKEIPHARIRVVDLTPGLAPGEEADRFLAELARDDSLVEVGTLGGRGTLKLLAEDIRPQGRGVELGPKDVVLVSGGAQGITAEVVRSLARRSHARFVLLGRTELLPDVERLSQLSSEQLSEKKGEIAEALKSKGERATPVAIEREFARITKSIEAHRIVHEIQSMGADALYVAADVTDIASVRRAADLGRKLFGRLTGVIHGAGLEESKLVVDKSPEAFARVFDAKILGAFALAEATREDPLRLFLNFGSVAGRFGNAGQADYSAANDALAKFSLWLRRTRGAGFPAVTIDWTAWDEKGMATRGSVMKILKDAGVEAIPLAAGVARCVEEIAHGMQDAEIVVAAGLGRLADPRIFATEDEVRTARPAPPLNAPAAGTRQLLLVEPAERTKGAAALVGSLEVEGDRRATAHLSLDADEAPFLDDHAIDGTPLLPGAFGLESFLETASALARGEPFAGARDVEFRLPLKLPRRRATEATVTAEAASLTESGLEIVCRIESQFVGPKGQRLGGPRVHFEGTLLFGGDGGTPAKPVPLPKARATIPYEEVYQRFFHGPSFRVLDRLDLGQDGRSAVGHYAWPKSPALKPPHALFATDPLLIELGFQAAGGHALFEHGHMALPHRLGRLRVYGRPRPQEPLEAIAHFKAEEGEVSRYDVTIQTSRAEVLMALEDFELIRLPSADPSPAPASAGPEPVAYRARWGHDLPVPLPSATGVLVNEQEIEEMGLEPGACLTAGERTDQERYRNDRRAREFFLGRLAAKEAVALLLGRPVREARGVEIRRLESGQPQVAGAGGSDVLVTISHQGPYAVALAVRRSTAVKAVGLDFDLIEPKPTAFETESFTTKERELLDRLERAGTPRPELQLRLWSIKEAVLKALGKGFALALHDVRITSLSEDQASIELGPNAQAALAEADASKIKVASWTRDNYAYALGWLS